MNTLLELMLASVEKEPLPLKTSEAPKNLPTGNSVLNLLIFPPL